MNLLCLEPNCSSSTINIINNYFLIMMYVKMLCNNKKGEKHYINTNKLNWIHLNDVKNCWSILAEAREGE